MGSFKLILHPPGTFALTPASMIAIRAVAAHQNLLRGVGIDWGCGAGCLAIAAAKIAAVERVIGLDIVPANSAVAHENALLNGVFLSISSQYGERRIGRLCDDVSGFEYQGVLASTDWTPFDLARSDLLECLRQYACEESRGGTDYIFRSADTGDAPGVNAREALARYQESGQSPFMKWQSHLFRFRRRFG